MQYINQPDFQVKSLLEAHDGAGKLIAAICAAPTALQAHGIGKGKNLTSYPAFKEALSADYNYTEVCFFITIGVDFIDLFLKDKTMADKLMSMPNDDTKNYLFCRLLFVVETFGHST